MPALDAREQLMLELINRARMDPVGEAARMGINLNASLAAGTISAAPKQVLAGNFKLEASSNAHSVDQMSHGFFSHTGTGGSNAGGRMAMHGYAPVNTFGWGENIAWSGSTGSYDAHAAIYQQHKNLFLSAGHRVNMLNASYEEAGIGSVVGKFSGYNAMMTTQNFAYDGAVDVAITGVNYTDTVNDNFYGIGEGVGARSVSVYKGGSLVGSTSTSAAGGYGVELATTGAVEVVFRNGGLSGERGALVAVATSNIKIDHVDGHTIESNATVTLTRGSQHIRLLGVENVAAAGNALNNVISGNCGINSMYGKDGADVMYGNGGNDRLNGGTGNDTLYGNAGCDTFRFDRAGFGDDKIKDFADGFDKLSFAETFADSIADFQITGNGTMNVLVAHGNDSILLGSTAKITLSAADFLFT